MLLGLGVWRALRRSSGAPTSHSFCVWDCALLWNPSYLCCGLLGVNCLTVSPCARTAREAEGILWDLKPNSCGLGMAKRSLGTVIKSKVFMCGQDVLARDEQNQGCASPPLFQRGAKGHWHNTLIVVGKVKAFGVRSTRFHILPTLSPAPTYSVMSAN